VEFCEECEDGEGVLANFKRSSYNGNEFKLTYRKPIND